MEWWEIVDYLISKGGSIPDPLCYFKNPSILQQLLKRGSKFPENNDYAERVCFPEIFKANFDKDLRRKIFESLTKDCGIKIGSSFDVYENGTCRGYTPLFFAVINNDLTLARAVLNLGALTADTRAHSSWYVNLAKSQNNQEMIALLISYGAKIDPV